MISYQDQESYTTITENEQLRAAYSMMSNGDGHGAGEGCFRQQGDGTGHPQDIEWSSFLQQSLDQIL